MDQDWSQFWPEQDWIGLIKFCCFCCDYSENIKNFSCDLNSQVCKMVVYFTIKRKNTAGTILQFELYHLCSHISLTSSSNVNLFSGSCLCLLCYCSLVLLLPLPLAQLVGIAPLIGVLLMHFLKKFRVWGLRLGCMCKFRFRVYL